ncbi:MAG: hypothetical protein HBSAPP03_01550 [Phycisphaerae bacterium]|nr:MAG: hypothetical protein HBSAPP03_01550 [Phycisphaerae bacterium]
MYVNRCVCHSLSFSHLLLLASETGAGFEQLRALTGCSTACTMCEPYVRKALATKETNQPIMSPEEAMRWLKPTPSA